MVTANPPEKRSTKDAAYVDKLLQQYCNQEIIKNFYDIFTEFVTEEQVAHEIVNKSDTYFGDRVKARNALIRADLEKQNIFALARDTYVKNTSDKILYLFHNSVFSWSTGGKEYVHNGSIESFLAMPLKYFRELYDETLPEIQVLSEYIDGVVTKVSGEYRNFENVILCHDFYTTRPLFGKHIPVYHGCLQPITKLSKTLRENTSDEGYFQSSGMRLKQLREIYDPEKNITDDFRTFITASDKSMTQIKHDLEETLAQYVKTFLGFTDIQRKQKKDEVKDSLDGFLSQTAYTLAELGYDVSPIYAHTFDMLMRKKSGWELKYLAKNTK